MPEHVPDMHKVLLDKRIAALRPTDYDHVKEAFLEARKKLRPTGMKLIDGMFRQLNDLHALLHDEARLTPRQRDVATAALMYFLSDNDSISDDHALAGLVDDALVVEAACHELRDLLKKK